MSTTTGSTVSGDGATVAGPVPPRGETVITLTEIRSFLASPEGQRVRRATGTALVLLSPWLAKAIFGRRSRLLKGVAVLGGSIAISRLGDWLRKWEPQD